MKDISIQNAIKNYIRWFLMPGLDLFTRRRTRLCRYWIHGPRRVLDAGFGNGWFSYLAYKSGASVIAVNSSKNEVQKAIRFYNVWKKIPEDRMKFKMLNLYNIGSLEYGFDEIICYETLEHIKKDNEICKIFWNLLKQDGVLHICCPCAAHPRWRSEMLDLEEKGYHVRSGYTLASYRSLLEPAGFQITDVEGMGGTMLTKACLLFEKVRGSIGDILALPFIILVVPFIWFDPRHISQPYSLYVRAIKRTGVQKD